MRRRIAAGGAALALVLAVGCGRPPAPARAPRVIVVGLDGADWQLLDRYEASGAMPQLAALVREGRSGVLRTLDPPLSPLVWTTMMTGVSPLEHRILDFARFRPGTGTKEPITSDERRAPAVWTVASEAGRTVGVFGMWATYPAEPVRGVIVSDRLFSFQNPGTAPREGVVSPPERAAWARDTLSRVEAATGLDALREYLPWLDEEAYRGAAEAGDAYGRPAGALRRILIETRVYHALATEWIREASPDLAIVYFQGTDAIGHVFAPFAPPKTPSVTREDFDRYAPVVERYFREIDRMLGEYRDLADRSAAVLVVVSDHGFYWLDGRPTRLQSAAAATAGRWHREEGIWLLRGPGIPAAARGPEAAAAQAAATILDLLGLSPVAGMAGPTFTGVAPRPGVPHAETRPAGSPPAETGDAAEAMAKLRALGYIGGAEPDRAMGGPAGSTRTAASWNHEGVMLRGAGRSEEARRAFETALQVDPGLASAAWNLSDLLFRAGGERDRSDDLLIEALAAGQPDGERAAAARVAAYDRDGDGARADRLLDRAIGARGDAAGLLLLRGKRRLDAERCREALADFRRAGAADPASALAPASEGLACLCLGDRAAAGRAIRRSLEIDPSQDRLREFLNGNGL